MVGRVEVTVWPSIVAVMVVGVPAALLAKMAVYVPLPLSVTELNVPLLVPPDVPPLVVPPLKPPPSARTSCRSSARILR